MNVGTTAIRPPDRGLPGSSCQRATRVTKSLLGYGIIAGPVYVAIWLGQALTRSGFDLTRDAASLLASGPWGWIQSANFLLTGTMAVAAAAGIGRALGPGRSARWTARLVGLYGAGVFAAGIFRADPMDGFPPGTQAGAPRHASWHGDLHYVVGAAGFLALIVAAFLLAARFRRAGQRAWAVGGAATGTLFLAANLGGAALGAHHPVASNLILTAGIVLAWAWLSAVSARLYAEQAGSPHGRAAGRRS
jgi:hypothetical protein